MNMQRQSDSVARISKAELERRIRTERRAILLVNAHSRKGKRFFAQAKQCLVDKEINIEIAHQTQNPDELTSLARDAVASGCPLVIIGGGDGTVSSVVDAFAFKNTVLGLLPLGTGNNFVTRTLKIPKMLDGAIDIIVNGKVADVDLGQVNGDYFANTVSFGFSSDVAHETPRVLKRILGIGAYGLVGLKNLLARERFSCTITHDGKTFSVRTHQVVVANGNYFGLKQIAPDKHVDSRHLVVFTMETVSRRQMARSWLNFFVNGPRIPDARYIVTKEVRIETNPPQRLDVDGELTIQTPATFRVAPQALKLMVPLEFEEQIQPHSKEPKSH